MKRYILFILSLLISFSSCKILDDHKSYYPVGDDPNIGWKSTMGKAKPYEHILFEANPIVRYSVFNDVYKLKNEDNNDYVKAYYISYRPQLRMYTQKSLPVKTPSYRILLGSQQVFRIDKLNLLAISLESGHYSNGQDGGAFTDKYPDESPESDAIYKTITSQTDLSTMLNRKSGNFSTDLTEMIVNFRLNKPDRNDMARLTHSFKLGGTLYHNRFLGIGNFGGYSDNDIRIYGKVRVNGGYELSWKQNWLRYSFAINGERIFNAHPSVNPWRTEIIFTVYPFKPTPDLGVFTTFVNGHDNYNYRFVDSGNQFGLGISWNLFPPIKLKGLQQ